MSEVIPHSFAGEACGERAEKLFQQSLAENYRNTDQLFEKFLLLQWFACIVLALFMSAQTWIGDTSQINIHVWAALLLGGAITVFPVWMIRVWPGARSTRFVVSIAQMLMSALLIGLTGGRIETHFHIFGSLVLLSFYRDWRVLVPATIVVALDHFVRGIYWPYTLYGVLNASPWRSFEHVGWVIFENVFLAISCLRAVEEMRAVANRTAALEASERASRLIFEQAPIGMVALALDESFLRVNARFCQMVGYSEEELLQLKAEDITAPEDIGPARKLAQGLFDGAPRFTSDKRYVRKNGQLLWVSRTACLMRDSEGNPNHFLLMVEDISERKRSEAELREAKEDADRANHAKSEFLSRMSHELRTPLNAVLGFGQLLERQNPTETQRTRIRYIISAGRHLLNLINEVLDISRIEAGNLQLSLEPVAVSEVLHETLDLMRPLAADREIELTIATQLDSGCYVSADRQRLKQVLLNLMTNAVKYTPPGGKVKVFDEFNEGRIRLLITDTGAGIPVEKLSRLFTPFDRLGAEHSGVEGTGLGLALCQRLTHAMGGTVGVKSSAGNGSTFWVELPLTESPLERLAGQIKDAQEREHIIEPRKLLYIEDNLSNLTLIEQMLMDEPAVELITAMQGQQGLDLARQHLPDLILLDLHLPDLPGWEVLARLQNDKLTAGIPVVVISADATARQIERLLSAGAHSYLTKPIDMSEFLRVVAETKAAPAAHPEQCAA
ncbi:MAG: ATP-binding protein, partial [Verrucomicrobiota bacterium]|nr:ATP-binding protein [Verrucomicrobiota bacterium]